MLKYIYLFILFFSLNAVAVKLPELSVEKYKLENGLTVLLHQDASAPVISFQQWFRVGSKDEEPGLTGLAHFFEHLMFKGTDKYSKSDFEKIVKLNGGSNNAFTSFDYTGYYVNLPSGSLERIIDLESDRMKNLKFDLKEINREREVVKEERRYRVDNRIHGYMNEALFSSLFKTMSYRWPIIGYMKDLNSATIKDFKEFYKTYYSPNNCVLVIVGDFDKKATKDLIQKYYGPLQAKKVPAKKVIKEANPLAPRRTRLKKQVQNPSFYMAFKSAAAGKKDAFVLDILAHILGRGESSRLYQDISYKRQSAIEVNSYNYSLKNSGVFNVYVSSKKGQMKRNQKVVWQHLEKFKTKPVTDNELEKAINQTIQTYVRSLEKNSGKARILALNEVLFGDYKEFFKDLDQYRSVQKKDIMRVAKTYFKKERKTIVEVSPL